MKRLLCAALLVAASLDPASAQNRTKINLGTQTTGILPSASAPAFTGDMTTSAGSLTTTVNKIGGKTVTLGGNFTTTGAFALGFTLSGATTLTLPTSGTLGTANRYTLTSAGQGAASWIKLGQFIPSQIGQHLVVRVFDGNGYNAQSGQQRETTIHFTTSNGSSVDTNGFAGWSSFSVENTGTTMQPSVTVVSNSAGTTATAFDLYFFTNTAWWGNGSYVVEIPEGGSWTNYNTSSTTNPGATGSSTVQLAVSGKTFGSPVAVSGNLSVGGTISATSVSSVVSQPFATLTANTTLAATHSYVDCDATSGNVALTLPSASSSRGRQIVVKKKDASSNYCSISATTDLIDGVATVYIQTQYQETSVFATGTTWRQF